MAELAFGAVAIFLVGGAMLERAEHAELALDGGADPMRHLCHAPGDVDVVGVVADRLAVGVQRAVHHDRGEAVLDGAGAGGFVVAVILVQADRDVRERLDQRVDHACEHDIAGIGAGAARGLDDHGRVDRVGGFHDGEALLHVVDVKGRHAVVAFGRVVEQLPQGDFCHRFTPDVWVVAARSGQHRTRRTHHRALRALGNGLGRDAELRIELAGRR